MPDTTPLPDEPAPAPAAPAEPAPASAPAEAAAPTPVAELGPAACAAKLAELFPALFGAGPVRPIKLRIQADIQQRAPGLFTKKSLSVFLHRHTTSTAYLKALAGAEQRYDLDGAPAGELADEHRQAARDELERRRAMHEARRAAERKAQRETEAGARREQQAQAQAQQQERFERATLLRAFETTTLTRANFCALKGIAEADLEARLAQARQEREQRPPAPPRAERERAHAPRRARPDRSA